MDFSFTDEQQDLRKAVRAFLQDRSTPEQVRQLAEDELGYAPDTWRQLTEQMGLAALALPEDAGGVGASFVEVAVVLEETGRTLLPSPYLSTVVTGSVLATGGDTGPLESLAEGGLRATLALAEDDGRWLDGTVATTARADGDGWAVSGVKDFVVDGGTADLFVVSATVDGEVALFAVEATASGVTRETHVTLDQTRRQARVTFDGAPARRLGGPGDGERLVAHALDLMAVGLAVEAVGAARHCLESTVEYLKTRVQFGKVIGSFQALKHRCADLAVLVESASASAYYAAWAVDGAPDELPVVAPLAKAYCTQALLTVAGEAIQLHGGIGFTWEHDTHLYFKRAKASELLFGTPRELSRLAASRAGL